MHAVEQLGVGAVTIFGKLNASQIQLQAFKFLSAVTSQTAQPTSIAIHAYTVRLRLLEILATGCQWFSPCMSPPPPPPPPPPPLPISSQTEALLRHGHLEHQTFAACT